MSEVFCPVCVQRQANLGDPSNARWIGPDGGTYCSMHFIQRFGHGEKLVRIADYVPPEQRKAPAPKAKPKPEVVKKDEVGA